MKSKYALPVGTVVKIRGMQTLQLIIGEELVAENQWMYIGVDYPTGYLAEKEATLFPHHNIDMVIHMGCSVQQLDYVG